MNQRPFSPVTGEVFKVENYHFQMIINRLIAKRPPVEGEAQFTFTPFRGTQKYESSKPITLHLSTAQAYPLNGTKLNFVAISYNPAKSLSFDIRMILNAETIDKEIGEYQLDASNFIDHFVQSENGAFTLKVDFNDDWAAETELYVERTRYAVERLIKEVKNPKPKEKGDAEPISHQSIREQRRKLDLKDQEESDVPHQQKFKKFSPKREVHEDLQKKPQYFSRTKEEERKQVTPVEPAGPSKRENQRSPKGQFVPKKQWIIPEAEKYMASKTKAPSRTNSLHNSQSNEQKPPSVVKQQKQQPQRKAKPAEEVPLLERLPIQPKYLLLAAIAVIVLLVASNFLKTDPQQIVPPKAPKPAKGKKSDKIEKPQVHKGGKAKK